MEIAEAQNVSLPHQHHATTRSVTLVLDTNVWLDWLVFDDPGIRSLQTQVCDGAAHIIIDDACLQELIRVLGYPMQKWTLSPAQQQACIERCRMQSRAVVTTTPPGLPRCADPDDQKFIELAAAAPADYLLTKDRALLALASRRPTPSFRITTPAAYAATLENRHAH
jgi:putative PIN family toxin of toxin-antitoxin system